MAGSFRFCQEIMGIFCLLNWQKSYSNTIRAIITHGLYIFYPIFHCSLYCRAVSITDNLCSKQENSSILGFKIFSIIIESSFKSRAGYNGVRTVDKSVFEYQKMFKTKSPISPEVIREQSLFRNKKLSIPKWRLKIARYWFSFWSEDLLEYNSKETKTDENGKVQRRSEKVYSLK